MINTFELLKPFFAEPGFRAGLNALCTTVWLMTRATAKYLVLLEAKSFGAKSEFVFDLIWLISLDGSEESFSFRIPA